jgi:RNA polymerase sigma-70 factor (ECF subfamily)
LEFIAVSSLKLANTDFRRAVEAAWQRARRAHNSFGIDERAFARHLSRHCEDAEAVLATNAEDLYVALGCGEGDLAALRYFEEACLREVPAFVAHLKLDRAAQEELVQALRARLLAPAPGGAKILRYGGKGPLGGWLRVAAVRLALTTVVERIPEEAENEAVAAGSARADPELAVARAEAAHACKMAFEKTLDELDPRERTVLRMHYVDGLSIDQIAVAYAIHRATAARWLSSARETVAVRTRKYLGNVLNLERHELDSVLRLVDNQLDLSLQRILGKTS